MKPCTATFALIISLVLVTACNRKSPNTAASSITVVFREAAVSVDVGSGWKRVYNGPGLPDCTPTLVSSNGVVGAMLFAAPDTTIQEAVTAAHEMFMSNTNSLKDSWHQMPFTSASGLKGQHISSIETKTRDGNKTSRQTHDFIFQRKDGTLVAVTYTGPLGDNADAIERMIQSSLKLE